MIEKRIREQLPVIDYSAFMEVEDSRGDRHKRGTGFHANMQNGAINLRMDGHNTEGQHLKFYRHDLPHLIELLQFIQADSDPLNQPQQSPR